MSFARNVNSNDPIIVREALLTLLNSSDITSKETLALHKTYNETPDKHKFLSAFESDSKNSASTKDPILLERWTHYTWIRLELIQLANQKASLNKLATIQEAISTYEHKHPQETARALNKSIARAIQEDVENGVSIKQSITKLSNLMLQIVGTEHPTDPLSQEARDTITQISDALHSTTPDEAHIKNLIKKLQASDPIPPTQRTVENEVQRNLSILFDKLYDSFPAFIESILAAYKKYYGDNVFNEHEKSIWQALEGTQQPTKQIVKHASWAGFDAEGNANVTTDATEQAIRTHRLHAAKKHSEALNQLIKKMIPDTKSTFIKPEKLITDLHQFQSNFSNYSSSVSDCKNTNLATLANNNIAAQFRALVKEHKDFLNKKPAIQQQLRLFGLQLQCFGMTFGTGHIRQDSHVFIEVWDHIFEELKKDESLRHLAFFKLFNHKSYLKLTFAERTLVQQQLQNNSPESIKLLTIIKQKYDAKQFSTLTMRELKRIELAVQHKDMFENIIISNTKASADMLSVEALCHVFSKHYSHLRIVPLLETRQDLDAHETILTDYIQFKKSHTKKEDIIIEVMFGFSDTERASGLSALISIQKAQENFIHFARKLGVKGKLYHGPGGDPNRGGLTKRFEKATLQGNARNVASIHRYMETLFYHSYRRKDESHWMEFHSMPKHLQTWAKECEEKGAKHYEHLHDIDNGLGKLFGFMLGRGAHWLVDITNSSSRASNRGSHEKAGDRTASVQTGGTQPKAYVHLAKSRAITATQLKEVLRDYVDLYFGAAYGLRMLGKKRAEILYYASETIRDIFLKTSLGISMSDFSVLAHALFGGNTEFLAKDANQRKQWATECESYAQTLKTMDIETLSKTSAGTAELMKMLSRLFAYLEIESEETRLFILDLNKQIHSKNASDVLMHYPEWKEQTDVIVKEVSSLSTILARLTYHVAHGEKLDKKHTGLNTKNAESKLTGVASLLGNIGGGITAARIMPAAFCEEVNYSENLKLGFLRAHTERTMRKESVLMKPSKEIETFVAKHKMKL